MVCNLTMNEDLLNSLSLGQQAQVKAAQFALKRLTRDELELYAAEWIIKAFVQMNTAQKLLKKSLEKGLQ